MITISIPSIATASVADIALHFPHAIGILNQYHLDYCCNGKKAFVEACKNEGLSPEVIWNEIQEVVITAPGTDHGMKFTTWDTSLLMDYIVQHHHAYVREAIPAIQGLLIKVCEAHGSHAPELVEIRSTFDRLAEELLDHLPKEENVLFPAIRSITHGDGKKPPGSCFVEVRIPVAVMENEHESAGSLLKSIRKLTREYTPPAYACPTYQLSYKLLKEFDDDLLQHIHLENNILFPRVTELQFSS